MYVGRRKPCGTVLLPMNNTLAAQNAKKSWKKKWKLPTTAKQQKQKIQWGAEQLPHLQT